MEEQLCWRRRGEEGSWARPATVGEGEEKGGGMDLRCAVGDEKICMCCVRCKSENASLILHCAFGVSLMFLAIDVCKLYGTGRVDFRGRGEAAVTFIPWASAEVISATGVQCASHTVPPAASILVCNQ